MGSNQLFFLVLVQNKNVRNRLLEIKIKKTKEVEKQETTRPTVLIKKNKTVTKRKKNDDEDRRSQMLSTDEY